MSATNHVVVHDGSRHAFGFECLHCGQLLPLGLPVSVDAFTAAAEDFGRRHRDCKVITGDDVLSRDRPAVGGGG